MVYQKIFDNRNFFERNRLIFEYPSETGENTIVFLPFFENPKITETQSANYAEYNPVARAGSLYAYTGASSRKLKVSFNMTLPHLALHPMGVERYLRVYSGNSKEARKRLFTKDLTFSSKQKPGDPARSLSFALDQAFQEIAVEKGQVPAPLFLIGTEQGFEIEELNSLTPTQRNSVLDTLIFFVTLLRTSVVNKVTNPLLGPPLIRLDFGSMYQSVPCICKSFNLSYEEAAGYDLRTTTPRVIKASINLEEIRIGDFSTYEPATITKRDNLTGWESAIGSPHTIDPLPAHGNWGGAK